MTKSTWGLWVFVGLAFVFLLAPIVHVMLFSFNYDVTSGGRQDNSVWRGFTLDNWANICGDQAACTSFGTSILVGITATIAATILGTLMALALGRFSFRGRGWVNILLFLPMATPEIVMGASLGSQFFQVGIPKSFLTVVIAHTLFCLSFVVVTVKARVASLDPALEEAGRDLYGSPMQVFFRVTLPLLTPGIVAAALLSFALSFDDFIITQLNNGPDKTFPQYIYTEAVRGVAAEVNVIATIVFVVAIVIVIVTQLLAARRRKRLAAS